MKKQHLIHVGNIKLPDDLIDKIISNLTEESEEIFLIKSIQILEIEEQELIKNLIIDRMEEYLVNVGLDSHIKIVSFGDIMLLKQVKNTETDFGFDTRSAERCSNAFTIYVHLNEVDGLLEFWFDELAIEPSKKEILIFPSYYTHMHKHNKSTQDKYFIKTTFQIGG